MNQLTVQGSKEKAMEQTQPTGTLSIIQMAVQQGANIETIERLVALKEREDEKQAKRAFDQALADFKANPPVIDKNKAVKFGNTEYKHATLDHVAKILLESLSRHGLTYTWEQKQEGAAITVSCVLSHIQGHKITNSLTASPDTSGSKNAIQAIGSAVTYLRRYTLLGVLGMAESGEDDDGKASSAAPGMPDETLQEWVDAMRQCPDLPQLKKVYGEAYRAAEAFNDRDAMSSITGVKNAVKAGLQ